VSIFFSWRRAGDDGFSETIRQIWQDKKDKKGKNEMLKKIHTLSSLP
jgi:hypothetical protein